jgi:hypothetical protein
MKVAVLALCSLLVSSQAADAQQAAKATKNTPSIPVKRSDASSIPKPHTLLDGTPIKLRLDRTVSSATAKVGDEVNFDVLEDVSVDGVVVIPKGSLALATVTVAQHKRSMGRAGKLNINIDSVRLADGEKDALRAAEGGNGHGHVGAMTGAMVATGIVFFPAAPLFLFMHGKDITIPKGTEITAYTDGDMDLNLAKFEPNAVSTAAVATMSQITIDANVPNCDIEVDGAFAGNTPSTLSLASGKHVITVQKTGYSSWTRTMLVSGSSIHIDADLLQAQNTARPSSK